MIPSQILGIPIIEAAAPSGFAAQKERELYSRIQAAIDMLRCRACGSLNYETTLFVLSSGTEKLVECRNCGAALSEILNDNAVGLLAFLPGCIIEGTASDESAGTGANDSLGRKCC